MWLRWPSPPGRGFAPGAAWALAPSPPHPNGMPGTLEGFDKPELIFRQHAGERRNLRVADPRRWVRADRSSRKHRHRGPPVAASALSQGHCGLVGFLTSAKGRLKKNIPFFVGGEECFCMCETISNGGQFGALDLKAITNANLTLMIRGDHQSLPTMPSRAPSKPPSAGMVPQPAPQCRFIVQHGRHSLTSINASATRLRQR